MKNLKFLFISLMLLVAASCTKEETAPTDVRDSYVGAYTFKYSEHVEVLGNLVSLNADDEIRGTVEKFGIQDLKLILPTASIILVQTTTPGGYRMEAQVIDDVLAVGYNHFGGTHAVLGAGTAKLAIKTQAENEAGTMVDIIVLLDGKK